ncbi:DUF5654 family protein [Methermicoccus shengliensis]
MFKAVFGTAENILAMLAYAFAVTVITVVATIWISRAAAKANDRRNQ